jgi:hypothetical protein
MEVEMSDFIVLPDNLDSLEKLIDGRVKSFLAGCQKLSGNRYSLDNLRALYLKDKNEFMRIIDELALRGFYFFTEKPNNLLPSLPVLSAPYIWSPEDQMRYRHIDFQKLGMAGFIHRFQVTSDSFFHEIPLSGFIRINRHIELHDLEQELVHAGFEIKRSVSEAEKKATGDNPENNVLNTELERHKEGSGDTSLLKQENEIAITLKVDEVFSENLFNTFRDFCFKNKIHTIDQLNNEYIEKYMRLPGVGTRKVTAVEERLADIRNKAGKDGEKHISATSQQSGIAPIEELFQENIFRSFRDFCKIEKIKLLSDLTDEHLEKYSQMKGVGIGKVKMVKQRVEQLHDRPFDKMEPEQKESILIDEVFAENQFLSFRKYCRSHRLKKIFEITAEHIEAFSAMRGVGVGKVEAVKQRINFPVEKKPEPFPFSPTALSLEINSVFAENKYHLFQDFCAKNDINILGQLRTIHIEMFKNYKMVGKKKVDEITNMLRYYIESEEKPARTFHSGNIFEIIKDKTVQEVFFQYGYETSSNSELTITDVEGVDVSELQEVFSPELLMSLSNRLQRQQTPKEVALKITDILSEREFGIILSRYGQEKTLEEVGGEYGITRERVRQIAQKAGKKIAGHLGRHHFKTILRLMSKSPIFMSRQELLSIVGTEHQFLVNLIKQENKSLYYYEIFDSFFFETKGIINIQKAEEFLEELPDVFNLYEQQQTFEEFLESIGIEDPSMELIEAMIQSGRYTKYGEHYSRGKLAISDVLSFLFKNYIHTPFKLTEETLPQLQAMARHYLNFELGDSLRSLHARMHDAENIILVDRATFLYFESDHFDTSIMEKIEVFLNEEFSKKDVVNIELVFERFQDELSPLGIHHKLHLYSLIQYYLDDKFVIGQGNTLNIFKNEKSKVSIEERMVSYMRDHGGLCSKEQLLEVAKPMFKVDMAISSSDRIIPWGSNYAILVEKLDFQPSEKTLLKNYFNQFLRNGYVSVNRMFKEMMFDQKFSSLLRKKGIDEAAKLSSLLKSFVPNVKGHSNFMYPEGSQFDSFEKVIMAQFDGETSREDLRQFAFEHGYKEMMATNFLKRLIEQGEYVEIDYDLLFPAKKLKIDESALTEIMQYLTEQMGEQKYLSLSNLKGYRRKLPDIDFRWNPYLLRSIAERCGYRQIRKLFTDYRYDKVIIVKEESDMLMLEDLVIHILQKEYNGNMHEFAIYDYLMNKGIVREQQYMHKKVLPYEIRTSEKLIIDELGNVALRKGN